MFVSPEVLQVERRDMSRLFTPDTLSVDQEGRWSIWLTSWEMIKSAPILGVGLGNYKWNYMDALSVSRETYPQISPKYTFWAHNEYLQWIAETGAIGGILFFSLLIYCIVLCLRGIKRDINQNNEKRTFLIWSLAALAVLMVDSCFSRPFHHVDTAFTLPLALAMISRLEAKPVELTSRIRCGVSGAILVFSLSGFFLFLQYFQGQNFLGKYFYNDQYITLTSAEERERYKYPLFLEDAYLQLMARENYNRTLLNFGDAEQNYLDAIRLLARCFETQPGYEELNRLMLIYQRRGNTDEARRYFKYYPPEERENFLAGRFDGKYMTK